MPTRPFAITGEVVALGAVQRVIDYDGGTEWSAEFLVKAPCAMSGMVLSLWYPQPPDDTPPPVMIGDSISVIWRETNSTLEFPLSTARVTKGKGK